LEAHLVEDMVILLFLASPISLFLVEILDKSQLMMCGVSVLKEHHLAGINSTVERNNQLQESTILQHYARQEVLQV